MPHVFILYLVYNMYLVYHSWIFVVSDFNMIIINHELSL